MSEPVRIVTEESMTLPAVPSRLSEVDLLRLRVLVATESDLLTKTQLLQMHRGQLQKDKVALVEDLRIRYGLGTDDDIDTDTGAITRKGAPP